MTIFVRNMWLIGDSKTAETGVGSYQPYILGYFSNAHPLQLWRETPARFAVGGQTVAGCAAAIDATLAAAVGIPDIVLFNLGANDAGGLPVQATYQANLAYIFDAIHAQYSAAIYVMKAGRQGYDANCDTLVSWNTPVIAARSSWVFFGPDERVFLKGSDDYASNTKDGTHPNDAGARLTAAQWLTIVG